jgi:hypothetical protein
MSEGAVPTVGPEPGGRALREAGNGTSLSAPTDTVRPGKTARSGLPAPAPAPAPSASPAPPGALVVRGWREELLALAASPGGEASDVDLVAALEELKATACAVQARVSVRVDAARRAAEAGEGVPAERRGRGVPTQLGLARRESPHRARALLGAAKAWMGEMPFTFAALEAGLLSEHRAFLLARETACLPLEARFEVDRLVCGDTGALARLGTKRLVALARSHAARLDPAALAARARRAAGERTVTLRPAPDTMTYLTGLLPVAQGVAVLAALRRAADAARAAGDPRSRGQVMADTLVERVTGQAAAEAVPVVVNLVLSDAVLLGAGHGGAVLDGYGVLPGQVARHLVANGLDADAAWVRRLYADPGGDLLGTTGAARFHAPGLAALLRVRDQGLCRTPYCDAPARENDHVVPAADGGATDLDNGQGLCVACNRAKQAPGWAQRPDLAERARTGRHTVATTTPTGHRYLSTAPPPPQPLPLSGGPSPSAPSTPHPPTRRGAATSPASPDRPRPRPRGRGASRRERAARAAARLALANAPSALDDAFARFLARGQDARAS